MVPFRIHGSEQMFPDLRVIQNIVFFCFFFIQTKVVSLAVIGTRVSDPGPDSQGSASFWPDPDPHPEFWMPDPDPDPRLRNWYLITFLV
jgi:hypothetical protein